MRAVFEKGITPTKGKTLTLGPRHVHHLVNVVRVREDEEILLLDGSGNKYFSRIINISKKKINLEIISHKKDRDQRNIDLLLAPPKKEAFLEILRNAVELNIRAVYLMKTQYSQRFKMTRDKIDKVLQGSYEQSNSSFEINLGEEQSILELPEFIKNYDKAYYFSTTQRGNEEKDLDKKESILIMIGPEAGFSKEEDEAFGRLSKMTPVQLDTNILRSQTAVSAAIGYLSLRRSKRNEC